MGELFLTFLLTVVANVASSYICKWLDRHSEGGKK